MDTKVSLTLFASLNPAYDRFADHLACDHPVAASVRALGGNTTT
jgi:hypothetical protein